MTFVISDMKAYERGKSMKDRTVYEDGVIVSDPE